MEASKDRRKVAAKPIERRWAAHLRGLPSTKFKPVQVTKQFARMVSEEVIPQLELGRQKLHVKHDVTRQIMANLFLAARAGRTLADSRDTSKSEVYLRRQVYSALEEAGFLLKQVGSEQSGKMTRYDLGWEAERWRQDLDFNFFDIVDVEQKPTTETKKPTDFAPVVLRDKQKKPKAFPKLPKDQLQQVRDMEALVNRVNEANLRHHTWIFYREVHGKLVAEQPNIRFRSIFNGDFQHGGRLYNWGKHYGVTHLPKKVRRTLLIDNEPIAELDFSGFHPRLLYHKAGLDVRGDVYQPEKVLPALYGEGAQRPLERVSLSVPEARAVFRNAVKTITNIALNAATMRQAERAAAKEIGKDKQLSAVLRAFGKIKAAELVSRITDLHGPISEHFCSGIGLKLQTEDAQLMLAILNRFVDERKPALGVHDAVICRRSDAAFAEAVMREAYISRFQFEPVITTAFP